MCPAPESFAMTTSPKEKSADVNKMSLLVETNVSLPISSAMERQSSFYPMVPTMPITKPLSTSFRPTSAKNGYRFVSQALPGAMNISLLPLGAFSERNR